MEGLLLIFIIFLMIISNVYVRCSYNKYNKIKNIEKISGFEIARKILDNNKLNNIDIVVTPGSLTDHYDPRRKVVRLSQEVFDGESVSSMAIAAHECGHAIQDKEGYSFLKFRSLIFPVVSITDRLVYILFIIGCITQLLNLIYLGIALMLFGLIFQIVTLPVEFNASSRASKEIEKLKLVYKNELYGINKVLKSASFTYVAGTLITVLNILRLFLSSRDR